MIEINLLPGPKKKKSAGNAAITLDQIKELFQQVKDPLLVGAVAAWIIGISGMGYFLTSDARRLAGLQDQITTVEAEQKRFQAMIDQKRKAEKLRDSLLTELTVIRAMDGERYVWGHIFEEVTRALPDYTWLVTLEPLGGGQAAGGDDSTSAASAVRFQIGGRTSDIQAYTRFLRQLANSPWVTNIVPGATNTVQEQDRPVIAFGLTAQFRRADSAYIRTAPLIQTLR